MKILITGGAGFIGSHAADHFMKLGHQVSVLDNLSRTGSEKNLLWLKECWPQGLTVLGGDVRSYADVAKAVEGMEAVFHFAGQVAVTTSIQDPRTDFEINTLGTLNVLEAARRVTPPPAVVFTSTNKVYGRMENLAVVPIVDRYELQDFPDGIDEQMSMDCHSPYGCSKGCADQYVKDYYRIYGVPTVVLRMSCIYGPRQFGNEDQGWVAHLAISALLGRPVTVYGDGRQVRDILFISDLMNLLEGVLGSVPVVAGQVYNIGGGPSHTTSVLELIAFLEELIGRKVDRSFSQWRPGDQPVYVSDVRKARRDIGWEPKVSKEKGIQMLLEWASAHREKF